MPFKLDAAIDFTTDSGLAPKKVLVAPGDGLTLLVLAPTDGEDPRLHLDEPIRVISQTRTEDPRGVTAWFYVFYVPSKLPPELMNRDYRYTFTLPEARHTTASKTANGTIEVSGGTGDGPGKHSKPYFR